MPIHIMLQELYIKRRLLSQANMALEIADDANARLIY
jgi:hypothetical protein